MGQVLTWRRPTPVQECENRFARRQRVLDFAAMKSRFLRPAVAMISALALGDLVSLGQTAPDLVAVPELGLRIQRGFRISLFADADLANDIQAMTLDWPVVTPLS